MIKVGALFRRARTLLRLAMWLLQDAAAGNLTKAEARNGAEKIEEFFKEEE